MTTRVDSPSHPIIGVALSRLGSPVPNATVSVTDVASGLQATVYSDENLTAVLAQPIACDAAGRYQFYAGPGRYTLSFAGAPVFQIPDEIDVFGSVSALTKAGADATYAPAALPSYVPSASKLFDPRLGSFNVNPTTLGRIRAALARGEYASGTPAHIVVYGHSMVLGSGNAGLFRTNAWAARLRAMLTRRYGDAGTGLIPTDGVASNDDRVAYPTGTWTTDTARGFGNARAGVSGSTFTFGPVYCDAMNVYTAVKSDSGVVQMYTDEGATRGAGSGAQAITYPDPTEKFQLNTVTPSSGRGYHFFRFDCFAPATFVAVEGFLTGGAVKVTKAGTQGIKLAGLTSTTNPTSTLYAPTGASAADLIILMCAVNDAFNAGDSVAAYTTRLMSTIATWQAAGADVMIVVEPPPQITAPPTLSPSPLTSPWTLAVWHQYVAALYSISAASNAALVDVNYLFADDWTTAQARGLMGDTLHPNDVGSFAVAQAVYEALVGGSHYPDAVAIPRVGQDNTSTVTKSGAACTLPATTIAAFSKITLTANCTFTFPTATKGAVFDLQLLQDGTGSRTATWPASVKWAAATAPTLTTTSTTGLDWLRFRCDGTNWFGEVVALDLR